HIPSQLKQASLDIKIPSKCPVFISTFVVARIRPPEAVILALLVFAFPEAVSIIDSYPAVRDCRWGFADESITTRVGVVHTCLRRKCGSQESPHAQNELDRAIIVSLNIIVVILIILLIYSSNIVTAGAISHRECQSITLMQRGAESS
ncbi:hypothetical protein E4U53_008059, partial [Claviceps sorghi]